VPSPVTDDKALMAARWSLPLLMVQSMCFAVRKAATAGATACGSQLTRETK